MKTSVKIEGLKELDAAMGELGKSAARGVLRRTLVKAAEPMRAAAERNAPKDTGALAGSIIVTSKIDNRAGKKEYGAVMAAGGSKSAAVQALRDARRAKGIGESFAEAFLGPAKAGKRGSIKAMVQEFGSSKQDAQPYMRPAFDAEVNTVLGNIKGELTTEIDKAVARARKRALKRAAQAGG